MEKKKLLLVAVSVGVVLFIIICIPLMIITPKETSSGISRAATSPYINNNQFTAIEAPVLASGGSNVQPIVPNEETAELPVGNVRESEVAETPNVTTITVEAPRTVAVPTTPATPATVRPTPVASAPVRSASASTPAPAPSPVVTTTEPARPSAAKPVSAPAPVPVPVKTTNNDFWVQTGAFSTQNRAEGAKEFLATKGITSIIENRDIDGKTWYRVRVGPYISETEASYWLALVKTIDGFADSQIRQTPAVLR